MRFLSMKRHHKMWLHPHFIVTNPCWVTPLYEPHLLHKQWQKAAVCAVCLLLNWLYINTFQNFKMLTRGFCWVNVCLCERQIIYLIYKAGCRKPQWWRCKIGWLRLIQGVHPHAGAWPQVKSKQSNCKFTPPKVSHLTMRKPSLNG